jgi:tripartite-type tricarboxylate transporter receptor subunit TctC
VVPFAAGGSADVWARLVASKLAATLHQPVVVDDVPGEGGNLGTAKAARARRDGRTALLGSVGPLVVHPFTYRHLSFDPVRDFVSVALLESSPLLLVVHPSVHATSVAELVALAKAQPGALSYASNGQGSPEHVAGEVFARRTGIELRHVPFDGAGPARRGLLAGQASMMFDPSKATLRAIREGRQHALATASPARLVVLPEVPTFAEAGLHDFELRIWTGLFVPRASAGGSGATWRDAARIAMTDADLLRTVAEQGGEPGHVTGDEFQSFLAADRQRWSAFVKESGVSNIDGPV